MTETVKAVNELQREAHQLLRELEKGLIQAHLKHDGPGGVARTFDGRFRTLLKKLDPEAKGDAQLGAYMAKLRTWIEQQRQSMIREAERAHRDRQKEPDSFRGKSNMPVGDGLTHGPGEDPKFVPHSVDKTVRQLVESVFSLPQIPGDLKAQLAFSQAEWIKQQDEVQEAFYVLQSALCALAEYMHRKLTLKDELVRTRDAVKGNKEISPGQAAEANQRVGELGKQSKELDLLVERWIQEGSARVEGNVRLNLKHLLDPVKSFLSNQERSVGISLKQNKASVDLGRQLKVIDPAEPSRAKGSLSTLCGSF